MDWPVVSGDYKVKDSRDPIAVVTLSSDFDFDDVAIIGPLKTENIGIEKVIANVISNPNIRFLIVCGEEVQGHKPGITFKALYENGIDERGKIINAEGAIPYIENIPREAIERFRRQVEFLDMVGITDRKKIYEVIKKCLERNPGPFDEPPYIIEEKKEIIKVEKRISKKDEEELPVERVHERAMLYAFLKNYEHEWFKGFVQGMVLSLILLSALYGWFL
ncbi:MAG: tetrahydromethanopterin S-methyltransferase subunit A [Candidatus Hydrothermarchaeota archaeon]